MKNQFLTIFGALALFSCSNDDDAPSTPKTTDQLKLTISGLENLGANYKYEGWIMVNGTPVSTGTFSVDAAGKADKTVFMVNPTQLQSATKFILSVEPFPDDSAAPSDTKYLVGDFNGANASLNTSIVGDYTKATGKFLLGSPTGDKTPDNAGIWFMDIVGGNPADGFTNMPTLGGTTGWKYEGWVVSNGTPVSTGQFSNPNAADEAAPFSGPNMAPPYPGEDFLTKAPAGVTFPGNLFGSIAVISIEPFPDNSPMPFALKPLSKQIGNPEETGKPISLERSLASFPTGTASR
jgi:hypothetical protein